jgi:hypothetical protein
MRGFIGEHEGQMPRKQTATVNFTLRMREDLRRRLAQIAKREERSLNEEIVHRLEQSLQTEREGEIIHKAVRQTLITIFGEEPLPRPKERGKP